MAYVKGNKLDRQQQVAQISQDRGQVDWFQAQPAFSFRWAGPDEPNPKGQLEFNRNYQWALASRANDQGQVGWQALPSIAWLMAGPDLPNPVATMQAPRLAQWLLAARANDQGQLDWQALPSIAWLMAGPDEPNPRWLVDRQLWNRWMADMSSDIGQVDWIRAFPTPSQVTHPHSDFPNPTIPRAHNRQYEFVQPPQATPSIAWAMSGPDLPNPTVPKPTNRQYDFWQPPEAQPNVPWMVSGPDLPNPQQPRRNNQYEFFQPPPPQNASPFINPLPDQPNPLPLRRYSQPDADMALWQMALTNTPFVKPNVEFPNPVTRPPYAYNFNMDPGFQAFLPNQPVVSKVVSTLPYMWAG